MIENQIKPRNIGEFVADFFGPFNSEINLYYPGIHGWEKGYEDDYNRIIREIQSTCPDLKIRKAALTLNPLYDNPLHESYRGNDFDIIVGDLHKMEFKGILFLPHLSNWLHSNLEPQESIYSFVNQVKSGGIIFYQLDRDPNISQTWINFLHRFLEEAFEDNVKKIESEKYGVSFIVKT